MRNLCPWLLSGLFLGVIIVFCRVGGRKNAESGYLTWKSRWFQWIFKYISKFLDLFLFYHLDINNATILPRWLLALSIKYEHNWIFEWTFQSSLLSVHWNYANPNSFVCQSGTFLAVLLYLHLFAFCCNKGSWGEVNNNIFIKWNRCWQNLTLSTCFGIETAHYITSYNIVISYWTLPMVHFNILDLIWVFSYWLWINACLPTYHLSVTISKKSLKWLSNIVYTHYTLKCFKHCATLI